MSLKTLFAFTKQINATNKHRVRIILPKKANISATTLINLIIKILVHPSIYSEVKNQHIDLMVFIS